MTTNTTTTTHNRATTTTTTNAKATSKTAPITLASLKNNTKYYKSTHKNTINHSHSLLALTLLILTCCAFINATHALSCYCSHCPQNDTCDIPDQESFCFKSVDKVFIKENNTFSLEYTYGCLSGADGKIAHLQCHSNTLKFVEPKLISCCKHENFCNENLPDPSESDDPRWNLDPPVDPRAPGFIDWASCVKFIFLGLAFLFLALVITAFVVIVFENFSKSTKDSRGSTCSLDADMDKFLHQHAASSSASTHSYSVTIDDICQKPVPPPSSNDEQSMVPDLTSGLGERMLNQRTMARAIGSGQIDHVGNGRFGRVFRGQYHGEDVAVKAFRTIDQDSWSREDNIFRRLNHDNIVRFIASEVASVENTTTEIWMILEYCPYGSLYDYLEQNEILDPQQAVKILYSIINGLNYLHEDFAQASNRYKPSIAHRDIKSRNILMKTPECCCIADFGHALIKIDEETVDYGKYNHLQVGTIRYMAPEILRLNESALNYRHFSTFAQADLYQYGLILWEICHRTRFITNPDVLHPAGSHKLPYDGVVPQNPDIQDMIKIVCDDQYRPPRYEKWDRHPAMKRLADLMVECWRPNPKARMETLGVKKKLRELNDQVIGSNRGNYLHSNFTNYPTYMPNFIIDGYRTKSSDVPM